MKFHDLRQGKTLPLLHLRLVISNSVVTLLFLKFFYEFFGFVNFFDGKVFHFVSFFDGKVFYFCTLFCVVSLFGFSLS